MILFKHKYRAMDMPLIDERRTNAKIWASEIVDALVPPTLKTYIVLEIRRRVEILCMELAENNFSKEQIEVYGRYAALFLVDEFPNGKLRNWIPKSDAESLAILRLSWESKFKTLYPKWYPRLAMNFPNYQTPKTLSK